MKNMIESVAQTVTVTDSTHEVLQHDIGFFDSFACNMNQNKLLNLIVLNYSGSSAADFQFVRDSGKENSESLTNFTRRCQQAISKDVIAAVREVGLPKEKERQLKSRMDKLSAEKTNRLIEEAFKKDFFEEKNKPIHGHQIRFTLCKKSVEKLLKVPDIPKEKLTGESESSPHNTGYKRLVKYLSRLFEAYAQLSLNERERILFDSVYRTVQEAVDKRKGLTMSTEDLQTLLVKPYEIMRDVVTGYTYLVGYSALDDGQSAFKPATFRMFRIYNLHNERSLSLSDAERQAVENRLTMVSPAYFGADPIDVRVRMNQDAMRKFNYILHGKPSVVNRRDSGEGWTELDFRCPAFQAKTYFFKFGSDAVIIQPESLRREMQQTYIDAVKAYQDL